MDDEQRFLFDLQGFLVVPGVLSAAELAALNAIADEKVARYSSPVEDWEEHQCSFWGQPLVDLIDHPKVVPYLLGAGRPLLPHRPRLLHLHAPGR